MMLLVIAINSIDAICNSNDAICDRNDALSNDAIINSIIAISITISNSK